jgi:hypothetical protein
MDEEQLERRIHDEIRQCEEEHDGHDEDTAASVVTLNTSQVRDAEACERDQEEPQPEQGERPDAQRGQRALRPKQRLPARTDHGHDHERQKRVGEHIADGERHPGDPEHQRRHQVSERETDHESTISAESHSAASIASFSHSRHEGSAHGHLRGETSTTTVIRVSPAASDLEALTIPPAVKLAGGLLIASGVAVGITGLQLMLVLLMPGAYQLAGPLAMMLSGGCVVFGWGTVRARLPAAKLGLVVGASTFVFAFSWIILAFLRGTLSLPSLAVVTLSSVSYVVLRRELPQIRRIDEARERLRAQGSNAGG